MILIPFYVIYLTQPSSMIVLLYIIAGIYQVGRSILEFTLWNVFPFIPDIDEIVTRQRREGIFAAVMTFARKSSVAIATMAVGLLLEFGGFVEGSATQTPEAIHTIVYTLVIGTSLLLVISMCIAFTFKLNKKTHEILVDEIDRLKNNGSKADVNPKTKEVVESLTGYAYENVWPEDPIEKENAS
ncbi:MFS transporter [Peribacillus butanolivorans]|uniref:MFS transporter n=1 Tax=Peribacillus butanolivorans TaxID=421767 RepID=UPI0036A6B654